MSFLFSSVYVWPSIAKFGFSINSAGSSCPPSSLTSQPEKEGIRPLRDVAMLGKNGVGEEGSRDGAKAGIIGAGVGKKLWPLSPSCNDANKKEILQLRKSG